MKPYIIYSVVLHGVALGLYFFPSFFSKNQLSWGVYYGVDFMGGSGGASGTAVTAPQKQPEAQSTETKKEEKAPSKTQDKDVWKLKKKGMTEKEEKASAQKSTAKESGSSAKGSAKGSGSGLGDGVGVGLGFGSGAGGGGGIENFPYPWYINILRSRLWEQWGSPGGPDAVQICQATFVIERSGRVSNIKIEKSSGSSAYDQLAMRAIAYASPLPPLPADYTKPNLTVHVEFRVKP